MIMFFYATLLPRIGSGPIWLKITTSLSDVCVDKWWTNMLYVNNIPGIIDVHNTCLQQTWYLATDMQCFMLAMAVLAVMSVRYYIGLGFAAFMVFLAVFLKLFG